MDKGSEGKLLDPFLFKQFYFWNNMLIDILCLQSTRGPRMQIVCI